MRQLQSQALFHFFITNFPPVHCTNGSAKQYHLRSVVFETYRHYPIPHHIPKICNGLFFNAFQIGHKFLTKLRSHLIFKSRV